MPSGRGCTEAQPARVPTGVASGAAGMLNAQVGTFKQRMGVNPYGDAGKVMSAVFRTYTTEWWPVPLIPRERSFCRITPCLVHGPVGEEPVA